MPPRTKITTVPAICDFICSSCRPRIPPLVPPIQYRASSSSSSSSDAVSQHVPYFPQPAGAPPPADNRRQIRDPARSRRPKQPRHGRREATSSPSDASPSPSASAPPHPRLKAHLVPPSKDGWAHEQPMPDEEDDDIDAESLFKSMGIDPKLAAEIMRDHAPGAANEAENGSDEMDGPQSEEAARLMEELGLDEGMLDDLMDDEKFKQMVGDDEMPDINVYNQTGKGSIEMEEDYANKETIEELDQKIQEAEEGLQKAEEEMGELGPGQVERIEKLMSLFDPDNKDLPESLKRDLGVNPDPEEMADFLSRHRELVDFVDGGQRGAVSAERQEVREDITINIPSNLGPTSKLSLKDVILPANHWAAPSKARITQLNDMLIRAGSSLNNEDELNGKTVEKTWRCYSTARHALSLNWNLVPRATWDLLWGILSTRGVRDNNIMHRVYILSKDMAAAGVSLTPDQQLLALEAMFTEGWRDEAIQNWKKHTATLGTQAETLVPFWNLGAQMHCLQGDIPRAQSAIRKVLQSGLEHNPRILFPFIDACARSAVHQDKAWQAYRELRGILGSDMKIEDYDEVIDSFLSQSLVEYGLYAFVDMMSGGTVDLHGRAKLPGTIANKFFFGKWLKRLLGTGDLDGSEAVVRMMLERGIRPAPMQMNGLIGAWLRTGVREYQKRAEAMAWEMVYSRLDFVKVRRIRPPRMELEGVTRPIDTRPPEHRPPRATSETFALVASYYRDQVMLPELGALWDVVKEAEIEIDGYLLTPLLETYEKTGREQEAFDLIFKSASQNRLQLTWATFKPLWVILGARHPPGSSNQLTMQLMSDRKLARRLFSEMMKSAPALTADQRKAPEYMARLVVPTFITLGDFHGALIALHSLVDKFNLQVTDTIALHVVTGQWTAGSGQLSARGSSLRERQAGYNIASFLARRLAAMGKDLESLTAEDRSRELTLYLSRVLGVKIPGLGTDKDVDNLHHNISIEMGVKYSPSRKPTDAAQETVEEELVIAEPPSTKTGTRGRSGPSGAPPLAKGPIPRLARSTKHTTKRSLRKLR
ncbi:pentatricopeptide repeat domain-containing protein [Zalerion maritima]|uniref:Pentatricopeptide repeat domain-containing protein n=1 Tax=Zalerion maritima TaxID=339359 RepID=A0AAD5WVT9_9PEZI|nr:pentatricopeptide repeat domain-containing protein [Zalerion maritima]